VAGTTLTPGRPAPLSGVHTQLSHLRGLDPKRPLIKLVAEGMSKSQREAHMKALKEFARIPPAFDTMMIDEAAICYYKSKQEGLYRTRPNKPWKWATLSKVMATLAGALTLLPMYDPRFQAIKLCESPRWKQAMKTIRRQMNQCERNRRPIISVAEMAKLLTGPPVPPIALKQQLAVCWLTAARPGDCLQLKRRNLTLGTDGKLAVTFTRGKGAEARGPYTVHTAAVHEPYRSIITEMMNTPSNQKFLWTFSTPADRQDGVTAMGKLLKSVNLAYAGYSVRRGALQALAQAGFSVGEIRQISGHTNDKTCLGYLDDGKVNIQAAKAGLKYGATLSTGPTGLTSSNPTPIVPVL
jgi:integrase